MVSKAKYNFGARTNHRKKDHARRTNPKRWSTRSNPPNQHVFRRVDAALPSTLRDQRPFKKLVWQYDELLSQIEKGSVRRDDLRQHLCDRSISCGGFRSASRHYNVRFRGQDSRCYRRVARRPFSRMTIQNATVDLGASVSAMKDKNRNRIRQKLEEAFLKALAPLDNRQ
jgi:hypothetical protein